MDNSNKQANDEQSRWGSFGGGVMIGIIIACTLTTMFSDWKKHRGPNGQGPITNYRAVEQGVPVNQNQQK